MALKELQDRKEENSWGPFYSFEIAFIIFKISIGAYTTSADENYKKYCLFENKDNISRLILINYINNNYFNLLCSKDLNLNNICLIQNLKGIKRPKNKEINFEGKRLNFE